MKDEGKAPQDWVDSFLSYLKTERGYSQQTLTSYGYSLRTFEAFYQRLDEELTWKDIDTDIIRRWVVSLLGEGKSARSAHLRLSALRSFYRYLLLTGKTDRDPAHLVRNPKAEKKLPVYVKQSEMENLFSLNLFGDDFAGQRDKLIMLTFYSTGIRLSELIGLNVSDVSLQAAEIKVTGKRNKQRIIPFGLELENELQRYIAQRSEYAADRQGALFVNEKGARLTREKVRAIVGTYLSKVTTQKKKSPHVLRHTFATVMLNNGADLEAVKELLGHESLATTEVYTHVTFAELKREYENAHPRA